MNTRLQAIVEYFLDNGIVDAGELSSALKLGLVQHVMETYNRDYILDALADAVCDLDTRYLKTILTGIYSIDKNILNTEISHMEEDIQEALDIIERGKML